MFILLLLISQIGCDWIEISQNHYRKAPTETDSSYENISSERQRNGGVMDEGSAIGNKRRIQFSSVKTTSLRTNFVDSERNTSFEHQTETPTVLYSFISDSPAKPSAFFKTFPENTIKATDPAIRSTTDVIYIDSMRPNINFKVSPTSEFNNKHTFHEEKGVSDDIFSMNMRKSFTEINNKERDHNSKNYTVSTSTNKQRFQQYSGQTTPSKKANIQKVKLFTKEDMGSFVNTIKEKKIIHSEKQRLSSDSNRKITNYSASIKYKFRDSTSPAIDDEFDYAISSSHKGKNYDDEYSNEPKDITFIKTNTDLPVRDKKMEVSESTNSKTSEINMSSGTEDISKGTTKGKLNGIWKLIKRVTDTIYKNSYKNINSKIKYLENLKSTILTSIEAQIDSAWPDDTQTGPTKSRRQRSAQARGHVEFPSSESTLMTISFLTFAVFLIKLVLQVIHTYKNKTMMVTPAVVAAVGRATAALNNTQR